MNKGFTLIELLVVISIVSVLSSIAIVNLNTARAKARDARRLQDVRSFITVLQKYYIDYGEWPHMDVAEANAAKNYCAGNPGLQKICSWNTGGTGEYMQCSSATPCNCVNSQSKPNTLGWFTPLDGGHFPNSLTDYFGSRHAPRDPWQEQGCAIGGGNTHNNFKYVYTSKYDPATQTIIATFHYVLEDLYENVPGEAWGGCSSGSYCIYGLYGNENGNLEEKYFESI